MDAGIDLAVAAVIVNVSAAGARQVGLALLKPRPRDKREDPKTKSITLYEFEDTAQYANLESAIVQTAPGHVYIADGLADAEVRKVEGVVEGMEATYERVPRSHFTEADALAELQKLAGDAVTSAEPVRAACCLLLAAIVAPSCTPSHTLIATHSHSHTSSPDAAEASGARQCLLDQACGLPA